jgi:C1A family cysteine protease
MESTLMPLAPAPDFSEKNLANLHGFLAEPANGGGNAFMSTATLTRWDGPGAESSDPYPIGSWWTTSPTFSSTKHVQNVIFIPSHTTTGLASTNNIKRALTTYGAVYSSFFWSSAYYKVATRSYYQPYNTAADPTGAGTGGHAVTIIGWNDNYAKTNFNTAPAGNGAWLVKNSWGTGWGNAGYFYVSYYDKYFGSRYHAYAEAAGSTKDTAVFLAEPATNYKTVYSYDKLGEVNDYMFTSAPKTGSFANVFTTTSAGTLKAVGFYTTDLNATVTIKIYKNPTTSSPVTGTLVSTVSNKKLGNMGYNTVVLTTQPALTKGQKFSVVLTVTNPTNNYYIPVEENADYYSSGIVSYPGQGYGKTGSTWTDWSTMLSDSHLCIKAYTS